MEDIQRPGQKLSRVLFREFHGLAVVRYAVQPAMLEKTGDQISVNVTQQGSCQLGGDAFLADGTPNGVVELYLGQKRIGHRILKGGCSRPCLSAKAINRQIERHKKAGVREDQSDSSRSWSSIPTTSVAGPSYLTGPPKRFLKSSLRSGLCFEGWTNKAMTWPRLVTASSSPLSKRRSISGNLVRKSRTVTVFALSM